MILCKIRAAYVREARCIISVFQFKQEPNNIRNIFIKSHIEDLSRGTPPHKGSEPDIQRA
jgi:hypothetical protein